MIRLLSSNFIILLLNCRVLAWPKSAFRLMPRSSNNEALLALIINYIDAQ